MYFLGCDISLSHAAVTVLNERGEIFRMFYLTDIKKCVVDENHLRGFLSPKRKKNEDNLSFHFRRMESFNNLILEIVSKIADQEWLIGIEDYSYGSKQTNSILQIAEVTGVFKYLFLINQDGCKFRLYDPYSIKMFATGNGRASKKQMVEEVREEGIDIPDDLIKIPKNEDKDIDGPGTDLADSYFIARLLFMEQQIREGIVDYRSLDEGKRRVFLRTTKANPVNILDAPFGELN